MHGWLLKDIYTFLCSETLSMFAIDPLKLNIAINAFLINPNIILYSFYSLNIYKYLKYHQYYNNQLKNPRHIYLALFPSYYQQ